MHFHFEWFSVILRLNEHSWVIGFCLIIVECALPRQSPTVNRVLHKRQRKLLDVIDRHVMMFLITYFRKTAMADVNFTSLVTLLITCHHCVSPCWFANSSSSSSSIGACRWRCCSCECPPSCSVLSSPKPWRESKIKLAQIFLYRS